ncbi:MAG: 5-formyltetrahydrofolate cyclo-ligase [Patescibacteria group bacterium]
MPDSGVEARVRAADLVISFEPFPDEPDIKSWAKGKIGGKLYLIPKTYRIEPSAVLIEIMGFKAKDGVIFAPGKEFDIHGTRHGRGRGWYDRLLSGVPKSWLRVGVCFEDQISQTPLERKEWDQPMDALLVFKNADTKIWEIQSIDK